MKGSEEACLNNFLEGSREGECPRTQGPSDTALTEDGGWVGAGAEGGGE